MTLTKKPQVTIITVTYNLIKDEREKFFHECINSIHNQTYSNIEHLIIDGGSDDGTLNIIENYAQKGWVKYISEPDKGMCDAMNKGIKLAEGEYIAILNSDDYYSEDAIESSIDVILNNEADYSYADTNMLDRRTSKLANVWKVTDYIFSHFYFMMPFNHETMLCKKEVYEKLGYYDWETYDTIADYDFVMKLILNDYKGAYVNKQILQFRMDGNTHYSLEEKKQYTHIKHIKNFHKLLLKLWAKILPENLYEYAKELISNEHYIDQQTAIQLQENWFLYYYIKFIAENKLKNFPLDYLINSHLHNLKTDNKKTKKWIMLFNIIPMIKIISKENNIYYKLFGIIPILKVIASSNKKYYKLANFIPFMAVKLKENKTKYQLFGFIPFFTIKEK